ncbi:MAG TPA: cation:dicarboxylase symporter family transporter [Bryobacteraceae bacterium]|nr:cation:dicarboxylase symporter family transporter [Bryobacteraceae bacterium]
MKRLSLTAWIFLGMAAGIALGVASPGMAVRLAPVANVFLRLIRSIIAPLLFGTLVYGIAGGGDLKRMGRIGLKAILYFEAVTTIALFLGLGAVNLVRPGVGMRLARTGSEAAVPETHTSLSSVLEHVFPASVIDAMARGDVLQIVVFSFLFGAACAAVGAKAQPVVRFCESLAEVMFRYTRYVMYLAPVGVGAAIAATVGSKGFGVLFGLGKLILTMYLTQALFVVVVLGAVVLAAGIPVGRFYRAVREPFLIAFFHFFERGGPAGRAGEHGRVRRSPAHRSVCPPHRIQLQPGRHHAVSFPGLGIRGAGGGDPAFARAAIDHDADVDAHQQRRCRGAPRGTGDPGRDPGHLPATHGGSGGAARHRCADGYGADFRECLGKLPGERGGGALGRRTV